MCCMGLPLMLMAWIVIRWIIDLNFLVLQFEIIKSVYVVKFFFNFKRMWRLERLGPFTIKNQYKCWLCLKLHWSHFTMLLKSFVIYKTFVDMLLSRTLKLECAFCYSNIHQMFSNFLWALIYFIRKATCVYIFKCIYVLNHWTNVVNFDFERP
jgi:hypothetical protein